MLGAAAACGGVQGARGQGEAAGVRDAAASTGVLGMHAVCNAAAPTHLGASAAPARHRRRLHGRDCTQPARVVRVVGRCSIAVARAQRNRRPALHAPGLSSTNAKSVVLLQVDRFSENSDMLLLQLLLVAVAARAAAVGGCVLLCLRRCLPACVSSAAHWLCIKLPAGQAACGVASNELLARATMVVATRQQQEGWRSLARLQLA